MNNLKKAIFLGEELVAIDVVAMLQAQEDENNLPLTFPVARLRVSEELLQGLRDKDDRTIDYVQAVIAAQGYRAITTAQECLAPYEDAIQLASRYTLLVIDRRRNEVLACVDYAGMCTKLRELDLGL